MAKLEKYDLKITKWTVHNGGPDRWCVSAFTHIVEGLGSPSYQILSTKFTTKKEATAWARSLSRDDVKDLVEEAWKKQREYFYSNKKSASK